MTDEGRIAPTTRPGRRLLLVDNYDSFVHTLARYFRELGVETDVVRNDAVDLAEFLRAPPAAVILSPGPCGPEESGVCPELVRRAAGVSNADPEKRLQGLPVLGVCLGHQAVVHALGGRVTRSPVPSHGRPSPVRHSGDGLFTGLPDPLTVGRYHSLIAAELPAELEATAFLADGTMGDDGVVMAVRHRAEPVFGVQFHPESVLTSGGHRLLANFLRLAGLTAESAGELLDGVSADITPSQVLFPSESPSPDEPRSPDFYGQPVDPAYPLPAANAPTNGVPTSG